MNEFLSPLDCIEKVDAPPYLLTRIHQRIKNNISNRLAPKIIWAIGCTFCLLVFFNIMAISYYQKNSDIGSSEIIIQMHLISENKLY